MARSGQLEVRVLCARDLKDVETFGRNDPFILVKLGSNQPWRTRTCRDAGKKAVWNEVNKFPITGKEGVIRVEVWDDNTVTSDQLIGSGTHPLQNVMLQGTESVRLLIIDKKGKTAGEIEMTLVFTADSGVMPAPGHAPTPGYVQPGAVGHPAFAAPHGGHQQGVTNTGYPGAHAQASAYPGAQPQASAYPGTQPQAAAYSGAAPLGYPGQTHASQPVHTQQASTYGTPPSYHNPSAAPSQGFPGQHSAPSGYPSQPNTYQPPQGNVGYPQPGGPGYGQAGNTSYPTQQGYPNQPAGFPAGPQPGNPYAPPANNPYGASQPYGGQPFGAQQSATYPPANVFGAPPSV